MEAISQNSFKVKNAPYMNTPGYWQAFSKVVLPSYLSNSVITAVQMSVGNSVNLTALEIGILVLYHFK